ncbi:MAG TPA: TMEM175 family protein [Dokdonella sp.]
MHKGRVEAFTDGVIAVIITIMVLELKAPHAPSLDALAELWPVFLSYVLSFVYVGIYWNNHHHMFSVIERVDGRVMWANLHLLFWLSLLPFTTAWISENHFAAVPTAVYGAVLLLAAIAWQPLKYALIACNGGPDCVLAQAFGRDRKGKLSVVGYLVGIALTAVEPRIACLVYYAVALIWLLPDRRIEKVRTA